MTIKNILVSQPEPGNIVSPFSEITTKYGVNIDYFPFFKIQTLTAKEFRTQRINLAEYTAIVFSAKSTIDAYFSLCEELRIQVPETMKYFCTTESIALYLQKHIIYRKRKIFFGNGTVQSIIGTITAKHKGENFLITCTDNLRPEVSAAFSAANLKNNSAILNKGVSSDLKQIDLSNYQMVVFYSPSDVKSLLENYPDFNQGDLKFAAYGSGTQKALTDAGISIEVMAPTPQAPSVAKAVMLHLDSIQ